MMKGDKRKKWKRKRCWRWRWKKEEVDKKGGAVVSSRLLIFPSQGSVVVSHLTDLPYMWLPDWCLRTFGGWRCGESGSHGYFIRR